MNAARYLGDDDGAAAVRRVVALGTAAGIRYHRIFDKLTQANFKHASNPSRRTFLPATLVTTARWQITPRRRLL